MTLQLSKVKGKTIQEVINDIYKLEIDTALKKSSVDSNNNNNNKVHAKIEKVTNSNKVIESYQDSFTQEIVATKWGEVNKGTFHFIIQDDLYDAEGHKPTLNQPNVNDTNVSGKGVPGDEIIISDPSGKELGKGIVKEDGTFEIELNRPLLPNEEITATPNTDGKSGTPTKETVYDAEGHKPTLNQPNVNDTNVSGKGVPGDVLPSTGISQLNIVVYSGYVLVVLGVLGVFLTVFKRKHSS